MAIGPIVVVVVLLALLGIGSAHVLSAVRAYVGGESLWSKEGLNKSTDRAVRR